MASNIKTIQSAEKELRNMSKQIDKLVSQLNGIIDSHKAISKYGLAFVDKNKNKISVIDEAMLIMGRVESEDNKYNSVKFFTDMFNKVYKFDEKVLASVSSEKALSKKLLRHLKQAGNSLLTEEKHNFLRLARYVNEYSASTRYAMLYELFNNTEAEDAMKTYIAVNAYDAVSTILSYDKMYKSTKQLVGYKNDKFEDIDNIERVAVIMLEHYLLSNDTELPKPKYVLEMLNENITDSWEDDLRAIDGIDKDFIERYITFKKNENIPGADKSFYEYCASRVMTDDDRYDEDGKLNINYGLVIRDANESIKNCFDGHGVEKLDDIENEKDRFLVKRVMLRYLNDYYANMVEAAVQFSVQCLLKAMDAGFEENKNKLKTEDLEKQIESYKNKLERVKKENKDIKSELDYQKTKNADFRKKLAKLNHEEVAVKESEMASLKDEIARIRKDDTKHKFEVDRLENKIKQLESENKNLNNKLSKVKAPEKKESSTGDSERIQSIKRDIPLDALYNSIKNKRILLVGGDVIHRTLSERGYNSIDVVKADDVNFSVGKNNKYDLIVIFTKLVSHSAIERLNKDCKTSDTKILNYNEQGVNSLIFRIFMSLNSNT